jgi:hypothetical protein
MNRRTLLFFIAIAVLVALNLWRWWSSAVVTPSTRHGAEASRHASNPFRLEDFEVRVLPVTTPPPLQRDLFRPKLAVKPMAKTVPTTSEDPPPKSAQELARDAAQAELSQLRCVGVAARSGRAQAFLQKGSENYLVSVGDKVLNRFIIQRITPEAVTLQDPETGVGGTLAVSGK